MSPKVPETKTRPDGSNGHRPPRSQVASWGDGEIFGSEVFRAFFQTKGSYYNNLEALGVSHVCADWSL